MVMCGVEIPLKWMIGRDEIGICEAMRSYFEGIYEAKPGQDIQHTSTQVQFQAIKTLNISHDEACWTIQNPRVPRCVWFVSSVEKNVGRCNP